MLNNISIAQASVATGVDSSNAADRLNILIKYFKGREYSWLIRSKQVHRNQLYNK
jgi:hypothetical protein